MRSPTAASSLTPQLPAPPRAGLAPSVLAAAEALAAGRFILLFDAERREAETDLLIAADACTPEAVHRLRKDGGGLLFLAVDPEIGALFSLPFAHDVQAAAADRFPLLRHTGTTGLPYDARSSFSLWVNHRDTFTGIPDQDRSLTIRAIPAAARDGWALPAAGRTDAAMRLFGARFRAPGHVSLCVGHPDGPAGRQGHTELATALARIGGITPVVAGCEMLDGRTGRALSKADAEKYAAQHGLAFLDGGLLTEAWKRWHQTAPRGA